MNRLVLVTAAILAGCQTEAPSATAPPVHVRQPGAFTGPPVNESSGAVRSRRHPDYFWTLNDSNNSPTLFLVDTSATVEGWVELAVANTDWEALAVGPCGAEQCLYVADIGDNRSVREYVTVYRVVEPTARQLGYHRATVLDSLVVRYQGGPQDAEALTISGDGNGAIITKGRTGEVSAFAIPHQAWGGPAVLIAPFWRLEMPLAILPGRLVTDAALSPDGQTLAVRTYDDIHLFTRAAPGSYLPDRRAATCPIKGLEPLGEAVTWWDDSTLLLTSEATRLRPGPITLLQCRAP